ncbi:hypothetical protein F5Y06DRAFT_266742 [Hypoxylon sp. FL0890]|nr:hypothetical protein F5Y06DRAFT_266742 [Hypoxylon sp. FL0890]
MGNYSSHRLIVIRYLVYQASYITALIRGAEMYSSVHLTSQIIRRPYRRRYLQIVIILLRHINIQYYLTTLLKLRWRLIPSVALGSD